MKRSRVMMTVTMVLILAGVLALVFPGCSNPTGGDNDNTPTLLSIEISRLPFKMVYNIGDTLDLTGLVVTGTYSDQITKPVTVTAANISGFNSSTPGIKYLTITVGGKTLNFTVTVNSADALAITSANSTTVVSGVGGTFQVTATGTTPIIYSLIGHPIGVMINSSTGLISIAGTTPVGVHYFTITAVNGTFLDATLPNATQGFTLTVQDSGVSSGAPSIISVNNTTVVNGVGGTFQVIATGTMPITYSLIGQPTGVSISSSTGLITIAGTTAVGEHHFTITATNGTLPYTTQSFILTVTAALAAPSITSASATTVVSGTGGTFQVTATGTAPITYFLGGQPTGVSISSSTGLITIAGTTTAGVYYFTITAVNGTLPDAIQSFALTVTAPLVAPSITSASTAAVVSGTGGTFQVTATGTMPITYSLSGQPTGVSISSSTGLITIAGTIAVGEYSFTIGAANGTLPDALQGFTLTVTAPLVVPSITSASTAAVVSGTGGTFQVTTTGTAPITYSLSGQPTGVSISSSTGLITIAGTIAVGEYSFTIGAANVAGSLGQGFTLTVTSVPIAPVISSTGNKAVTYGTDGTHQVTVTGTAPISYSLSGQPAGVSINSSTGLITIAGTTAAGPHSFTITAANGISPNSSQTFSLTVDKLTLTATATAVNREYNGSNVIGVTITPTNRVGSDVITLTAAGTVDNADAGTNKPVAIGSISLSGTDSGNYTPPVGVTNNPTVTITKVSIYPSVSIASLVLPAVPSPVYTGTNPGGGTVLFTYSTAENGGYSSTVPTSPGTYWVKATVSETTNYQGSTSAAASFTIAPMIVNTWDLTSLITVPVTGAVPNSTAINESQYMGTIQWKESDGTTTVSGKFASLTVYKAIVTLTAKTGYTFTGVAENYFSHTGATTVGNNADSGIVTISFPATVPIIVNDRDLTSLITVPVTGTVPNSTTINESQYMGTIQWKESDGTTTVSGKFAPLTIYKAIVTLTAKTDYTFTGVAENYFSHTGATTITNSVNSSVVTITFPATFGGTSNISISFEQIADVSFTFPVQTIHKVLTPNTVTLSFTGIGYADIQWFIGNSNTSVSATSSYTLNSADYDVGGQYWITVEVLKDDVPYSKTINFNVVY